MGKRPRTPHFIAGLGDGSHQDKHAIFQLKQEEMGSNTHVRKRDERFARMDPNTEHWSDTFPASNSRIDHHGRSGVHNPGAWQVSAYFLLGIIVLLSAIFLHLLTALSPDKNPAYTRRPSRRRTLKRQKKKKDDDWSDYDEEENFSDYGADNEGSVMLPYQQRFRHQQQEHRHRKLGAANKDLSFHSGYYLNRSGAAVISPYGSASLKNRSPGGKPRSRRGSEASQKVSGQMVAGFEGFQVPYVGSSPHVQKPLVRTPKQEQLQSMKPRPLSGVSSFSSTIEISDKETPHRGSMHGSHHLQPKSPMEDPLSFGHMDATPRIAHGRRVAGFQTESRSSQSPAPQNTDLMPWPTLSERKPEKAQVPFVPRLDDLPSPNMAPVPAPRSIVVEELKLVQMESGSVRHWDVLENQVTPKKSLDNPHQAYPGHAAKVPSDDIPSGASSSSVSLDSNDPRGGIVHKRPDLRMATDAASSLLSSIDFSELKLQEVIGGGGFGQVWKATWRGTPVAVKVLTGSAQAKKVPRAILEEFAAEINLLKGMRHPNICLYMGACVDPPNRAIITELAANGSLWDALRLPLAAPHVAADGLSNDAWPSNLYHPDPHHGAPPSASPIRSLPVPPKYTWPWVLVKKVACGAARGMAYLHSGNPPVLHRDLKSANLLLDESYTVKVCDFGLSRLKAQERKSMTGNCGTVQWMAPEVLANERYNEKADVFSFGIICWELLTRECPYDGMTAIQCALAVLNRDYRPEIPKWCPPSLHALIAACLKRDPTERPTFQQLILAFDAMP